jgi:hypothetical protein
VRLRTSGLLSVLLAAAGENTLHDASEAHRRAAEQHELAAHAYRTAAEHSEKWDNEAGKWRAKWQWRPTAKSGRIVTV